MVEKEYSKIDIGIVGGGTLCRELIKKTAPGLSARVTAVADTDSQSPGLALARKLGLKIFSDFHELCEPRHDIDLIIITVPEQSIFDDILETKSPHIRVLAYHVFKLFWEAIGFEEKRLRERTEEMALIMNGIQDFILVITPEMEIADVNEALLLQMHRSREDVVGRKCYEIFQNLNHQCNSRDIICPLKEVIRNKSYTRQVMTRKNAHNEASYFEVNVYPIWEKSGKIFKFIEISRDITARFKEEEEITRRLEQMVEERTRQLQETHAQLLHQDKMASLGKLSASVVHEINNPIAGILNLILLMQRIIEEEGITHEYIDQFSRHLKLMETETVRTSRIVSNLLAFSPQSNMELKTLNLNRLIEQTLFLNANLLKINGVKVSMRLDPDIPDLVGAEDQIQQTFMNFISNAAEAIEAVGGGGLTVETKSKDGSVVIKFSDTGVGIPRENMPKLFEPFFTTKKQGKGVGLGLSLAYGIIQEHGGTIHVKSKEGKGTTLTVTLPLRRPAHKRDRYGGIHGQH